MALTEIFSRQVIKIIHIHSVTWNKIYRPKSEGGLGMRKIEDINVVFLANKDEKFLLNQIIFRFN